MSEIRRAFRHFQLGGVKLKRVERLNTVEVALEVLQEHNLLVDRFWILEEVVLLNVVAHSVRVLRVVCC